MFGIQKNAQFHKGITIWEPRNDPVISKKKICFDKQCYRKFPKYLDTPKKIVVITLKVEQNGISLE